MHHVTGRFVLAVGSVTNAVIGSVGAAGFILIGIYFIVQRHTLATKKQGLVGRLESAQTRARVFSAMGVIVAICGVGILLGAIARND